MADDPKDPSAKDDPKDPAPDPKDDPKDLGEAGKKALDTERKARKAAEKAAKDFETRLKEIEDKDKTESDKLRDERDAIAKERDDLKRQNSRLTVAVRKSLNESEMKRLVGDSEEDLEADADELLKLTRREDDKGKGPGGKPKESLRGGGDPTDEPAETDPAKLAEMVEAGF